MGQVLVVMKLYQGAYQAQIVYLAQEVLEVVLVKIKIKSLAQDQVAAWVALVLVTFPQTN